MDPTVSVITRYINTCLLIQHSQQPSWDDHHGDSKHAQNTEEEDTNR